MAARTPTRGASLRAILLVWGALSLLGAALHQLAWNSAALDGSSVQTPLKLLGNICQTLTAPAWIPAVVALGEYQSPAAGLAASALGFGAILAALCAAARLRRWLLLAGPPRGEPAAPARRRLLIDGAGLLMVGGGGGAVAAATLRNPGAFRVAEYTIAVRSLPAALHGLSIVQLTDTHAGPVMPDAWIRRACAMALELRPDVLVLTGDYVYAGADFVPLVRATLAPLENAPMPVLAVLGNHDHYAGADAVAAELDRLGITRIENGRRFYHPAARGLTVDPTPGALCIAGVGDLRHGEVDLAAALGGVPDELPRILLAHNPDTAEHPAVASGARRIDLMLSGHTHGGQVRLPLLGAPWAPSAFGARYLHGLNQGPACPVLTCAGVGLSGPPVRLGAPPEIARIRLVAG